MNQVWVAWLVVDDESGVDIDRTRADLCPEGMGVTTEARFGFEHDEVASVAEGPGGAEPGDARSDDSYSHEINLSGKPLLEDPDRNT